jgi:hypothetical protein
MSRTYKDKPYKYTQYAKERVRACFRRSQDCGEYIVSYWVWDNSLKTKKRKEVDHEYHWMNTPSWWTRMMMNRPQRREAHLWEREVSKIQDQEELEEVDIPNVSHKPHVYYW